MGDTQIYISPIIPFNFRFGDNVLSKFCTMVNYHYVITILGNRETASACITTYYFFCFRYFSPVQIHYFTFNQLLDICAPVLKLIKELRKITLADKII